MADSRRCAHSRASNSETGRAPHRCRTISLLDEPGLERVARREPTESIGDELAAMALAIRHLAPSTSVEAGESPAPSNRPKL